MKTEAQFERESDFHDQWATETDVEDVAVEAAFVAPTAFENHCITETLGDLRGKKLLDIGCGLGESSVMFAKLGAEVTATDLSPGMLQFTQKLATHNGVALNCCVGPGESLPLPDAQFDVVYTANTIHHLADPDAFFREVQRLLKPEGTFCSWDPVKYNPIINIYRRMASQVRSEDEAPLGVADLKRIRQYFQTVQTRHFWLLTLSLFLKYYFIDRVHPNHDRYWKRIYKETDASLAWWKPLRWLDSWLLRLPLLKWLSWNMVVIARNPTKPERAATSAEQCAP